VPDSYSDAFWDLPSIAVRPKTKELTRHLPELEVVDLEPGDYMDI
jgi:hypothetical protein